MEAGDRGRRGLRGRAPTGAADGRDRWFLARGSPQRDRSGAIVRWFCTGTDIDDQKKTQEELRRSEERFRLLAEAIPQKVWMADTRGAIHYLNQCWFDYTGLTYEQASGWGWLQMVHPAERQAEAARWTAAIEHGDRMEIEHRLKRGSDGSYRWHLVRGAPLRDETGAIVQWVGISTDVDDQRRQAELLERLVLERTSELERSNRRLEEFASVASHDLQEPLRKIQAFSDRLQAKCGLLLGKQGKEYIDRIVSSATRMRNLINDILVFSRVSTNTQPLKPVDLEAAAREVVSDLEGLIQQTGGSVQLGRLPTIHADPPQIRQLLQNLIGNGLKFQHPDRPPVVRSLRGSCQVLRLPRMRLIFPGMKSPSRITASDLKKFTWIEFFRCFSDFMDGKSMREQAWAWRSAAASSSGTAAGSRRAARPVREPPFL